MSARFWQGRPSNLQLLDFRERVLFESLPKSEIWTNGVFLFSFAGKFVHQRLVAESEHLMRQNPKLDRNALTLS